jgi:hypothetical protein
LQISGIPVERRVGNGQWIPASFSGEFAYMLESGDCIPQANVLTAKAYHVVKACQIEYPSLVFVRLPTDNAQVYHFVKLVSNIEFNVQSQCFVHSKFKSQRSPDQ